MGNENAADNTAKYKGFAEWETTKKGKKGDAEQGCPKGSYSDIGTGSKSK